MKYRALLILIAFLISVQLFAENKKLIQVKFVITEPQYKSFYGAEIPAIERDCSRLMADFLNSKFGFFQFQLNPGEATLKIELADSEQQAGAHSSLKEVGFKLSIEPQVKPGIVETTYWVFRPVERYIEGLPDVRGEFVDEVIQTFRLGAQSSKEELVKNILSQVDVADDFYFIQARKLFVVPITKRESNIAELSRFQIVTKVSDILGTMVLYDTTQVLMSIDNKEAIQHYHLPATYTLGSLVLEKLKNSGQSFSGTDTIEKKIYILKHVPLPDSELELVSPETILTDSNAN
ncbi:hypothetical protein [Mangrovibacterium diazotrophicum]|uniref:Uncharacterized protein n=1 Tax=Mangrovibacterium diazotrophicum TaxID=1261403 RepID=A0A419VYN4_9BACT|nr:hypothetical protein [Mangrovibacterium diazotrophicum]RKD88353.1 hypothetical protein BC643_3502 [Mangrovibacterium diazotrophicum]